MHSFHQLSILERATDHKCNYNCNRPREMWVGFKCNGLIVFSQRGGASKVYNTCVSRLPPPSPPPTYPPPLLGSLPPPPPPPQLCFCWARHLWLWCSGRGVFSREGWSVSYDRSIVISDGSEPWENSAGAQESGDDQQRPSPPSPAPLGSLIQGHRDKGRGGGAKLGLHVVPHTLN